MIAIRKQADVEQRALHDEFDEFVVKFLTARLSEDTVSYRARCVSECAECMEAHVCVQQSAFDLLRAVHEVYIVVDAIGSRFAEAQKTALRRFDLPTWL